MLFPKLNLTLQRLYNEVSAWHTTVQNWLPGIASDRKRAEDAADAAEQSASDALAAAQSVPGATYDIALIAERLSQVLDDGYGIEEDFLLDSGGQNPAAPTLAAIPDLDPANLSGGWAEAQGENIYEYDLAGTYTGTPTPTLSASNTGDIGGVIDGDTLRVTLQGAGATGSGTVTATNSEGGVSRSFDVVDGSSSGGPEIDENLSSGQTPGGQTSQIDGSWYITLGAPANGDVILLAYDPNNPNVNVRALPKATGNVLFEASGAQIASVTAPNGARIRARRTGTTWRFYDDAGTLIQTATSVSSAAAFRDWIVAANPAGGATRIEFETE
ncbi:MAG: hypothetical protein AAGI52_06685 [Bacteroidota bacterium]